MKKLTANELAANMLKNQESKWITIKQANYLKSLIMQEDPNYRTNDYTYITSIENNIYYKLSIAPNKAGILTRINMD